MSVTRTKNFLILRKAFILLLANVIVTLIYLRYFKDDGQKDFATITDLLGMIFLFIPCAWFFGAFAAAIFFPILLISMWEKQRLLSPIEYVGAEILLLGILGFYWNKLNRFLRYFLLFIATAIPNIIFIECFLYLTIA